MEQEQLKSRMRSRQLPHAMILAGEGRFRLADTLAAAWVCTGAVPPCGVCSGCKKAAGRIHPDIIRADTEGEGLKADAVRALRSDTYIRPNEAPKKVYLLEHGEMLNPTGQNILLKLLEEGPAYACFLFLTPNPEGLLETIRSRCVVLWAREETTDGAAAADEAGQTLARFFMEPGDLAARLPFLVELEKKEREELAQMLETTHTTLVRALPAQPALLKAIDKLAPIRAACAFNISSGHLAGWIASTL